MREIELHYQKNIRDLGGLVGYKGMKVKSGRIFRGGFLDKLSEEDVLVMESLHLTDIIDFRSEKENKNRPDYYFEGVNYHNFPPLTENVKKEHQQYEDGNLLWFISPGTRGRDHMMQSYRECVTTPKAIEAYRNFFKILLMDNRIVYFHCSQGKDRAGIASCLVEIALGISQEDALKDYLKSNKAMQKRIEVLVEMVKNKPFYNEEYHHSLLDVFSAKEEYLNAAIEEMIKMHGSVLNYIKKELKVNVTKLRKLYLE